MNRRSFLKGLLACSSLVAAPAAVAAPAPVSEGLVTIGHIRYVQRVLWMAQKDFYVYDGEKLEAVTEYIAPENFYLPSPIR